MEGIGMTVVGYARVSTEEQATAGNGLAAQGAAIREACERRGWTLARIARDEGASGGTLDRPGLRGALEDIAEGRVHGLVVSKLDRLSRSVADFSTLVDWLRDADAVFVALDLGIDSSTPAGQLVASVMASVAEWERSVIGTRTKEGLAAVRASGRPISGPTVSDDPALHARIVEMRDSGMTYDAIAAALNAAGVPTPRGGQQWRPSSLQRTLAGPRRRTRRTAADLPAIRRARSQRSPSSTAHALPRDTGANRLAA